MISTRMRVSASRPIAAAWSPPGSTLGWASGSVTTAGGQSVEVVSLPVPGPAGLATVAWAGDRVLYPNVRGGRVVIATELPEQGASEEVVTSGGYQPAATTDGHTVVFTKLGTGDESGSLWRVDADGSHAARLAPRGSSSPQVTPDDRQVIFLLRTERDRVPVEGAARRRSTHRRSSICLPRAWTCHQMDDRSCWHRETSRSGQSSSRAICPIARRDEVSRRLGAGPGGHPMTGASRTSVRRPARTSGSNRSTANRRISSRVSPMVVRSLILRGRTTANASPSPERPSPTTSSWSLASSDDHRGHPPRPV